MQMQSKRDIVIVGGGVIGLSAAYYLHRDGASVTVLDRGKIGEGCSFGNAGWVTPSHLVPLAAPGVIGKGLKWMMDPESPFYIKPRLSRSLASWLWEFKKASSHEHVHRCVPVLGGMGTLSRDLYRHFSGDLGLDFQHEEQGLVYVPCTDHGFEECIEEAEWIQKEGQDVSFVSAGEMHKLEPTVREDLKGGIFCPGDAHINPSLFTAELGRWLKADGVDIRENCTVTGWDVTGNTIHGARTEKGSITANEFVLAGGAWSPEIIKPLGLNLPVQPAKGYSLTVGQTAERTKRSVYLYEAKIAVTPLGSQIRYAGTLELAGLNLDVNERRVSAIRKAIPKYMNNFDIDALGEAKPWAGLRPCSPDGMPYIGRTRSKSNLSVATGHAMVGVSLAPITGKLISQILSGESTDLPIALMDPDRFQV